MPLPPFIMFVPWHLNVIMHMLITYTNIKVMISITFIRVTGKVTLVLGHSLTFQFDLPLWLQALFHCNLRVFIKREIGSPFMNWVWVHETCKAFFRRGFDEHQSRCRWGKSKSVPKNVPQFLGYYFRENSILCINRWNYKVWHSRCITNHSSLHQIWLSFKTIDVWWKSIMLLLQLVTPKEIAVTYELLRASFH